MHIIGIGGKAGAGKKIVAALAASELNSQGYAVNLDSFAKPIKDRRREHSGAIDKEADRGWLQSFGDEMRAQDPLVLIKGLAARNNLDQFFRLGGICKNVPDFLIVTDVRRMNEAEFCHKYGVLWIAQGSHKPLAGKEADHITEKEVEEFSRLADATIPKMPSLKKLEIAVAELISRGAHIKTPE